MPRSHFKTHSLTHRVRWAAGEAVPDGARAGAAESGRTLLGATKDERAWPISQPAKNDLPPRKVGHHDRFLLLGPPPFTRGSQNLAKNRLSLTLSSSITSPFFVVG